MTISLGLTGNMAMGKTTAAAMFAAMECPIWDADATVHSLYNIGGGAVAPIADLWPHVVSDGRVDRQNLKDHLNEHPDDLAVLETVLREKLAQSRRQFLDQNSDAKMIVFDIPLLFEKELDQEMDATACVFVDHDTQHARILERGTMTADQVKFYLSKQMPIAQKLARSDFRIDTSTFDRAQKDVHHIYDTLTQHMTGTAP